MRAACRVERAQRCTWTPPGQSFPDVSQEHDALEVVLEETQEAEKFAVVVSEAIRPIAWPQMEVGDHRYLHGRSFPSPLDQTVLRAGHAASCRPVRAWIFQCSRLL